MKFSKKADVRALVVALAGAATTLVLLLAGTAFAHAAYESSDPSDGGTVSSPPSQVTANYSEPLQEADSWMDVTDPCGRDVGGETSITADSMTVSMSGSAKGEYIVEWRARSSVDNHVTTGDFSFTSTGGDPCPGEEPESEEEAKVKGSSTSPDDNNDESVSGSGDTSTAGGNVGSTSDRGESRARSGGEDRNRDGGGRGGGNDEEFVDAQAPSPEEEATETRSTLEGIPVGGLIATLVLAALIGAAAGKIYFSLSGEGG